MKVLNYGESNLENGAQCCNYKSQSRKNTRHDISAVPYCTGGPSDPVLAWGRTLARKEKDERESIGPDSCLS